MEVFKKMTDVLDILDTFDIFETKEYDETVGIQFPQEIYPSLYDFILVQLVRTKRFRTYFTRVAEVIIETLTSEYVIDEEHEHLINKEFIMKNLHNLAVYDALTLCNFSNSSSLPITSSSVSSYLLDTLESFRKMMGEAIEFFVYNQTNTPIMTSDNPVCIESGDEGITDFMTVYFPLTPKLGVFFLNPNMVEYEHLHHTINTIPQDKAYMVNNYNMLVANNAHRKIFSPVNDFGGIKDFVKGKVNMRLYIPS